MLILLLCYKIFPFSFSTNKKNKMEKVEGTNSAETRTKTRKSNVKQECKCKFHDEFSTMSSDSDKRLYNTSSNDIKNIGNLHLLIEHEYLTKKRQ